MESFLRNVKRIPLRRTKSLNPFARKYSLKKIILHKSLIYWVSGPGPKINESETSPKTRKSSIFERIFKYFFS